jgi:hypothetical protein
MTVLQVPAAPAEELPAAAAPVAPPKPADEEPPLFEQGDPYAEDEPRRQRDEDEPPERPRRRRYEDDEPDNDEEPPRRRRRRPPPPSGRGPLFWIAVIFGVLLIGSCACCGGVYFLLPGENWQRHESPAGRFSVELPGPVRPNMPIPGMKPDPNVKVEGTVLWKRGEVYIVSYLELPPAGQRLLTDQQMLDEVTHRMESDPEIKKMVRNDPIKVSGYPGREIEYLYEDGGTYVGRIVITNRRMYIVVGGGRFVRPGNKNLRRFLDSFQITGPR